MKKYIKILFSILLVFILTFVFVGCGEEKDIPLEKEGFDNYTSKIQESRNSGTVEEGAKIIYTARYTIQTKDIIERVKEVQRECSSLGGYVCESDISSSYASVCYRVPVDKFEDFLDYIDAGEGIASKKISSEDVELSFNQYSAKIESLNSAKAAYQELMKTPNISVYEISEILNSIEKLDAELLTYSNMLDTLKNKIAYTFIYVSYRQTITGESQSEFVLFFQQYGAYLLGFVTFLGKAILYLVPFAVIAGVVLLIIFKQRKKKRASLDKKE